MRFVATLQSGFELRSQLPFLSYDKNGELIVDTQKPFEFPTNVQNISDLDVGDAVWLKSTIGCADDICMIAIQLRHNAELTAHGIRETVVSAVMETSRNPDVQQCKYVLFEHPILSKKYGKPGIVLENTECDSSNVLVVQLNK